MKLNEKVYKVLIGPVVLLWLSFTLLYVFNLESTYSTLFYFNFILMNVFNWIFLLGHGIKKLGGRNVLVFFLIASFVSFIGEYVSIVTGIVGEYYYTDIFGPKILGLVPFLIPVAWFNLMYITRMFTDFILKGIRIPHYKAHPLLLAVFDSIALVALDLSIDPLSTYKSVYVWLPAGEYAGTPIANYFSWFIVGLISFGLFRLFETRYPSKNRIHDRLLEDSVSSLYVIVNLITITMIYSAGLNLAVMASLVTVGPLILLWLFVILKEIKPFNEGFNTLCKMCMEYMS